MLFFDHFLYFMCHQKSCVLTVSKMNGLRMLNWIICPKSPRWTMGNM